LEPVKPFGATSPIFNYPYSRTAEALFALSKAQAPHAAHGHALRYVNPQTGGSPMPTLGTQMQLLPQGFVGLAHRQTAGRVFSVVEGAGVAHIQRGDVVHRFDFQARDHFVVPSWWSLRFEVSNDSNRTPSGATLFSYSDKPVHEALAIFREQVLTGDTA
jgi:gentisate 1,2-dioxygenase